MRPALVLFLASASCATASGDEPPAKEAGSSDASVNGAEVTNYDAPIFANDDSATETSATETSAIDSAPAEMDAAPSSVPFPSTSSTTFALWKGAAEPLGMGGGAVHYQTGDWCEQAFARDAPISQLDLSLTMSDVTSSCASGMTNGFAVKVNGTLVGSYAFTSGASPSGNHPIAQSYTFPPIAPSAGSVTLRIEATTTVCPGGGAWNWIAGGTATMH
jgi:hypothetical protein